MVGSVDLLTMREESATPGRPGKKGGNQAEAKVEKAGILEE